MKCPNCRNLIDDDSIVCEWCGIKISPNNNDMTTFTAPTQQNDKDTEKNIESTKEKTVNIQKESTEETANPDIAATSSHRKKLKDLSPWEIIGRIVVLLLSLYLIFQSWL